MVENTLLTRKPHLTPVFSKHTQSSSEFGIQYDPHDDLHAAENRKYALRGRWTRNVDLVGAISFTRVIGQQDLSELGFDLDMRAMYILSDI